jgi:hypothetical protein
VEVGGTVASDTNSAEGRGRRGQGTTDEVGRHGFRNADDVPKARSSRWRFQTRTQEVSLTRNNPDQMNQTQKSKHPQIQVPEYTELPYFYVGSVMKHQILQLITIDICCRVQ